MATIESALNPPAESAETSGQDEEHQVEASITLVPGEVYVAQRATMVVRAPSLHA